MAKRLLLLNGLAILAVVLSHSAGAGQVAMFLWTDRYLPVAVPNWDQFGTLSHYILLVIRSLGMFAIPAFLFVCGFFIGYATRGKQAKQIWKIVGMKIAGLLVPYLIWSGMIFTGDAVQGIHYRPSEYLLLLLTGGPDRYFYFVPLLCFFYLLAPLLIPIARARYRLLLGVCALSQLGTMMLWYLRFSTLDSPRLVFLRRMTPAWSPTPWILFFALGIVVNLHTREVKRWLVPRTRSLLVVVAVLFLLNVFESDILLQTTRAHWFAGIGTISFNLYGFFVILCFIAFEKIQVPFAGIVHELGKRSYGIYLLHYIMLSFAARVMRLVVPQFLAYSVPFVLFIFAVGLGGPLLLMRAVRRSPARRWYRYLFG